MISIKPLDRIKHFLAASMEWGCVILIALLTILSIISVVLRYCFDIVFIQAEELITFLFVGSVFLGLIPVIYKKEHINVALIQNALHGHARKALIAIQHVVIIVIQALFIYASYYWISTNLTFLTPGLKIPFWTVYWVVPFCSLLSGSIAAIDLIEIILTPASAEICAGKESK